MDPAGTPPDAPNTADSREFTLCRIRSNHFGHTGSWNPAAVTGGTGGSRGLVAIGPDPYHFQLVAYPCFCNSGNCFSNRHPMSFRYIGLFDISSSFNVAYARSRA